MRRAQAHLSRRPLRRVSVEIDEKSPAVLRTCRTSKERRTSGQDIFDHDSSLLSAGKLLIQALELERESLVVDAEAVQNRRLEIAHVNGILTML